MEQEQKVSRSRITKLQIQKYLDEYAASSGTVKDFCQERSINPITFHKWKSRYTVKFNAKKARSNFVPVDVVPAPQNVSSSLFAEVGQIRIYQPVSASFLKELSV